MIRIGKPFVEKKGGFAYLKAIIRYGDKEGSLGFKVLEKDQEYLCPERADAFLAYLLYGAMIRGENICCEAPVSAQIYEKINRDLIAFCCAKNPHFKRIYIFADTIAEALPVGRWNATGLSAGVDCFTTLACHTAAHQPADEAINCVTLFNNGFFTDDPERKRQGFEQALAVRTCIAQELGFPLIVLETEEEGLFPQHFSGSVTYRCIGAILAIRKAFKTYYFSGGYSLEEFCVDEEESALYDYLILRSFTTSSLRLVAAENSIDRIDKMAIISKYPPALRHLNVCFLGQKNCGTCEKCVRTLLAAELLGELPVWAEVFDLEQLDKTALWAASLRYKRYNSFHQHLYMRAQQIHYPIPFKSRLLSFWPCKETVKSFLLMFMSQQTLSSLKRKLFPYAKHKQ